MPLMRSSMRTMPQMSSSSSGRTRTAVVVSGMVHSRAGEDLGTQAD